MSRLAQVVESLPPSIYEGVALGVVLLAIGLLWRYGHALLRDQDEALRAQDERMEAMAKEHQLCSWRLEKLIRELRRNGIDIPEDVWIRPPWMSEHD